MAFKRLPNNFGTIYKLSGNRRNPWIARRRTGEVYDDEKHIARPVYTTVGYYPTRKDAMEALAKAPENLTRKEEPTFGEVYELWKADKYGENGMSESYISTEKHLRPIMHKKMVSFRAADIEAFINRDSIPRTVKHFVRTLMNQTFDYAMRHDIIEKNYCTLAKPRIDVSVKAKKGVFTASEVEKVWNTEPSEKRDMVLFLLYTGMRINECLKLTVDMVNLAQLTMRTGSKTEAGKDRIIPIHSVLKSVVERRINETQGKLFHFSYETARLYMSTTFGHDPHECRHTFATQAMECGMNDEARKRILGHASVGVTNKVYTHLDIEFLKNEMEKLRY